MNMFKIAVFISGKGTNAMNLAHHFSLHNTFKIQCIISTKPNESLEHFCLQQDIVFRFFPNWNEEDLVTFLQQQEIQLIVLAGFLKKIGPKLLGAFPKTILNIHPSLLPKYGGHGMFGMHVHRAVHSNREKESGISIHVVNGEYDQGEILEQHCCEISEADNPENIAAKVQKLEYAFFPAAVENYCHQLHHTL